VFSYLRTLTTWHCPHSPAASRRCSSRSISPAHLGPQQQTCSSCCGRVLGQTNGQIDGHHTVSQTLLRIICKKGSPYSITDRRVPEMIPVLGSQPAGDVSHKPPQPLRECYQFCCLVNRGTMGVTSLPKTVARQRRDCDLNPGPSAPQSSTLTTRLPCHPTRPICEQCQ